jgi:integrase
MQTNVDIETLRYAIENGMIDLSSVQEAMEKKERERYLSLHPYEIWQGKNGKWYTYIPSENGRVQKQRSSQGDIENLIVEYHKSKQNEPIIKRVFYEWIDEKLEMNEIGRGTYDRYSNDYKRFFDGTDFENSKMKNLTEEELELFIRKTIVNHNLTQKAFSNFRTLIFGIFKHAKKKKYTSISITHFMGDLELSKNVFKKIAKRKEDQVYLEDEIPLATEYLKSNPSILNLGLLLTFQTGIRTGELAALKPEDVVGKTIHIQRQEIKYKDPATNRCVHEVKEYPKTDSGDRYVIITENALETIKMIKRINPNGEYLFEVNGKRILTNSYNDGIGRMCKELKITRKSMHKIRRTYGTTLLDGKVDESIIMEQMGHSDITTTRKFYYYSNKNKSTKEAQISKAIVI